MRRMPTWTWFAAAGLAWAVLRNPRRRGTYAGAVVGGPGKTPKGGRFGYRRKSGKDHKGIDVFADEGTPVFAAAAGKVVFSGIIKGYGETVVIRHAGGSRTLYSHMTHREVSKGQAVAAGRQIGGVGRTANGKCGRHFCTSPAHLHFEVITDDGPVNRSRRRTDPAVWLARAGTSPSTSVA